MNRPRAVDFLDQKEAEESFKNEDFSDEEPLVIEEEREQEFESEENSNNDTEDIQESNESVIETLPSGAISKGKNSEKMIQYKLLYKFIFR